VTGAPKILRRSNGEAWASLDVGSFGVSCFASDAEPHAIGRLVLSGRGDVATIHHEDGHVATMLPRVARLYGLDVTEAAVARAIAACRIALAEHALAELRVAELLKRAEVVS
jgi:hypothetical protein